MDIQQLRKQIDSGTLDGVFQPLYAPDRSGASLALARERAGAIAGLFQARFGSRENAALFSGPGRTEIGGNHTDHQHGHVLCGSVDMDMLACAAPNGTRVVRMFSDGYPELAVSLDELDAKREEEGTSAALVRGVAAKIAELGFTLGGFDACAASTVLSGSGLSSSAAYEILIGNIFNTFFCKGKLDAVALAKIGQFAENVYFGKPCGLMDQMASSAGGATAIDFREPENPSVERVDFDFSQCGHALCIIDTASSHDDLTEEYAAIPREMGAVAERLGGCVLRDVEEAKFREAIPRLRQDLGDRAVLRAMHFFAEDRRAVQEAEALKAGDFPRFLALVNASGLSSELLLQNAWCACHPERQAVSLSLALGRELLDGAGAIRIHGGGFAGTIQAFVPVPSLDHFKKGMEAVLGEGKCHILHVRPVGGCVIPALPQG